MRAETRHGVTLRAQRSPGSQRPRRLLVFVIFVFFVSFVPERVTVARLSDEQPPRQAITSTTTAGLVDAVVRDKNGTLITNLSAADFELAEDGVPQTIDSFTRVSHGGGIGVGVAWKTPDRTLAVPPTARPEPAAGGPLEDAATVALV